MRIITDIRTSTHTTPRIIEAVIATTIRGAFRVAEITAESRFTIRRATTQSNILRTGMRMSERTAVTTAVRSMDSAVEVLREVPVTDTNLPYPPGEKLASLVR